MLTMAVESVKQTLGGISWMPLSCAWTCAEVVAPLIVSASRMTP